MSLDARLRPDEVSNVRESWIDTDNAVLRIPKQESSKNVGNWTVSLTERTATAVERWKDEHQLYDRYTNSHLLWLTSQGNPYRSKSLRWLLHQLCDEAGIETGNRSMSWYTIRHSVGTLMTKERDLAVTKSQLRHKAPKTTMKYNQMLVEDRRDRWIRWAKVGLALVSSRSISFCLDARWGLLVHDRSYSRYSTIAVTAFLNFVVFSNRMTVFQPYASS